MPTRKERARYAERQRAQQAKQKRYLWIGGGALILVVLVAVGIAVSGVLAAPATPPQAEPVASTAGVTCSSIQTFPSQGQTHIAPNDPHPAYSSNPPTSGWHWANPQDWGIYTQPQVQEQLVHNLEHGGIVVQYNGLAASDVERLTALVQRDNYHMILAPYPGLPSDVRVALTAWMHLQTCNGVNENTITAFVNAFRNKGPELVP